MNPLFTNRIDAVPDPASNSHKRQTKHLKRSCFQLALASAVLGGLCATNALAQDNWQMTITVDNQYDIYFGDSLLSVPTFVGGDTNWMDTEVWSPVGVDPTAFLYVATASDQAVAQGFIGEFQNLTTGNSFNTSDNTGTPWEVFPAGAYLAALNVIDSTIPATVWPISTQPTQSQVQTAVNYATTNGLWVTPTSAPGYDNASSPSPWGARPGIPGTAEWIWYDTGVGTSVPYPAPFDGFNHDEFLVFRIAGAAVPEPGSAVLALLAMSGMGLITRRKRAVRNVTNWKHH
ncbi:MAG: PEP-CTERM sorting domain-containing protein [Rhodothermia bacterium]